LFCQTDGPFPLTAFMTQRRRRIDARMTHQRRHRTEGGTTLFCGQEIALLHMINLFQAMQVFVKVAETESFVQSAMALNVSTSIVTRHVANLETHLGIRLFQRTTRKVALTTVGRAYAEGCRSVLAELERVELRAATSSNEVVGDLKVVASGSFSLVQLAPLFAEYQLRYPQVILKISLTDSEVDLLDEGFDVGVVADMMIKSESVVARQLVTSSRIPVAAASYLTRAGTPQVPADLGMHKLIGPPAETRSHVWSFRKDSIENVQVSLSFIVESAIMQKQAVLAGMGIALLPDPLVSDELRSGKLVRILRGYSVLSSDVAVSLVYPSREFLPYKVRLFIDLAMEHFQ
ncbi:LysR family transcriptional regulator, partial [uncultured Caballeronia sp.]|uniref:LysR family transcriptional regulator n=1 Tax=uncultured Caballeronia sp. TaxID=1827198 RepID=UPI0035CC6F73